MDNFNPKYIKNLTEDSADINIFDEIGEDRIDGGVFARDIQMLNDFGVKTINVHINSPGGNVIHGFSIFSALRNSKATIITHIEGVAASMA